MFFVCLVLVLVSRGLHPVTERALLPILLAPLGDQGDEAFDVLHLPLAGDPAGEVLQRAGATVRLLRDVVTLEPGAEELEREKRWAQGRPGFRERHSGEVSEDLKPKLSLMLSLIHN